MRIYQATGVPGHFLTKFYDDIADLEIPHRRTRTAARRPVSVRGRRADHPPVRRLQRHGDRAGGKDARAVAYGFLESRLFNLAFWAGQTDFADHDLSVGIPLCFPDRPALIAPATEAVVEESLVPLSWSGGGTHVGGYRLWASIDGSLPRLLAETDRLTKTFTIRAVGRVAWWVEVDPFDCPPSRSATGFFTAPPPPERGRLAVAPADVPEDVTRDPR